MADAKRTIVVFPKQGDSIHLINARFEKIEAGLIVFMEEEGKREAAVFSAAEIIGFAEKTSLSTNRQY